MSALLAAGARAARPGEFTERAFLGGRIDLAQAEAVADVIHAETDLAHRLAARQIEGALSRGLSATAETLRNALAEVEARVDFAEDVDGGAVPLSAAAALVDAGTRLEVLLSGSDLGRRAREGMRVVLVGAPNAGKSSLFNALLGEDRAIIAAEPGTTRDALAERIDLGGVPVRLIDTAGVRDASGLEALGVERTRRELADADLAIWVVDSVQGHTNDDGTIGFLLRELEVVHVWSKADLPSPMPKDRVLASAIPPPLLVSTVTGEGLPRLRDEIRQSLLGDAGVASAAEALVTNSRHIDALSRAQEAIATAREAAAVGAPGEIVAGEIRLALDALGEVTGEAAAPDLLERIFARFCIGK